jgi:hypothetical protein
MPSSPIASAAVCQETVMTVIGYLRVSQPQWRALSVLCCQDNSPQHPCTVSQRWRNNIAVDLFQNLARLDVAVEETLNLRPHERKELRLVHYTTTHNDSLG